MGEIADMMLDGTLCEGCGVYMDTVGDEPPGFPMLCDDCALRERAMGTPIRDTHLGGWQRTVAEDDEFAKVPCPHCNRKVKRIGLEQHIRDKHGIDAEAT